METNSVFISTNMGDIGHGDMRDNLAHAYCYQGSCKFTFNMNEYEMRQGDSIIIRKCELFHLEEQSPDLIVMIVFVTPEFVIVSSPRSNYGARGQMALFENPVMHLDKAQQDTLTDDFSTIRRRLQNTSHNFYDDMVRNSIEAMILDFFDFHSKAYGDEKITTQYSQIMQRFVELLDRGDYVRNREINYYADKLCITPKYLSEVCKKVSGYPANYWITRYTVSDIARQLKEKKKSFVEISDEFEFSSPAYFSRYVQKYLRASPTDFRE